MKAHLHPELGSIATARQLAAEEVRNFPPEFQAEVILVTSELVTNAVVHAQTDLTLDVTVKDQCVLIEVDDESPAEVELHPPDLDSESGRGLHIIEVLSHTYGVRNGVTNGKCVWAKLKNR